MPNRSATRANGFINPSEGLSFSGAAVVVQQQASALKQTVETATFDAPGSATQPGQDFVSAGLLPGSNPDGSGFSAGLAAPSVASSLTPVEDAEATDLQAPLSDCDTAVSELYCVYEVQEGDTLSTIADRFGLTSTEDFANWELLVQSNNSVVVDPDDVSPGQKLIIPRGNAVLHTVLSSETLIDISDQYGVSVDDIMSLTANGITNADAIAIGTEILIPNPARFAPVVIPEVTAEDDTASEDASEDTEDTIETDASASSPEPSITGGGPASSSGFIWPVTGPITNYMTARHPLGIDIDLFNNSGAPISAAMGGVVTFAGGNACCSYGYYVVVDHGNGFQTLYAHLSSIGVSVGEVVSQGQYLGAGGSTGYSTGDHLHLEFQLNGSRVNPMNYLP